ANWLLDLDGNLDKSQRGPAQGLVFAEDQRQIAAYGRVGHGDSGQHARLYIFHYVGARDEADADIGGDKTLEQFAGIQFHGDFWLEVALVERGFQGSVGAADLGQQDGEADDLGDGGFMHAAQRMAGRSDNYQLIAM